MQKPNDRYHAREHLISFTLVFLMLLLQACYVVPMAPMDGEVLELGVAATARGLELARQGSPLTYRITDGKLVFYLWQVGQFVGGACLNCGCKDPVGQFNFLTGGRGMAMTGKTAGEIVHDLVDNYGWTEIPAVVASFGRGVSAEVGQMGNSLTGFMVMPVAPFLFEIEELPTVY